MTLETLEFENTMRTWDTIDWEEQEHWLEHVGASIDYATGSWHDIPRDIQESLYIHESGWWDDNCICEG